MSSQDRHIYEYDFDLAGDTAPAKVIRMVGKNKEVFEIGAGPGSITRFLKEPGGCEITALELDKSAIEKLAPYCDQVVQADLNDPAWCKSLASDQTYDVVVAADVLEHLLDPLATLTRMKHFVNKDGYLVISLPHIAHNAILACLLQEDFQYRDWGLLDRTHLRFFGLRNMQALFEQAGLHIVEAEFVYVQPEASEFSNYWTNLPPQLKKALNEHKFGSVYQVVIKAKLECPESDRINLMAIETYTDEKSATDTPGGMSTALRNIARAYLPPGIRMSLRDFSRRLGIKI